MATVYLGLGSNMGDKEENIRCAVREINERVGEVVSLSAFYVTEPEGFASEQLFVNAACRVETSLLPFEVLDATESIEREMGRTRKSAGGVYADRVIDIDILLYDKQVINTERLTIPHPRMWEREFVMRPLGEVRE